MSKTVILSDLHVGDMSDADDFYTSGNFEKFITFLEFIKNDEEIEKIVIAGDFFELWQCKVEKILQMYVDLWKVFLKIRETGKKIIYIPGNHDSLPFAKLVYKVVPFPFGPIQLTDKSDIDEEKKLIFPYYSEENLWIEHGHRFDKYNRDVSTLAGGSKGVLGKFIAQTIGILERFGAKDIDEQLEKLRAGIGIALSELKKKFTAPFYKIAGNLQSYVTPASKEYAGDYSEYDVEGSIMLGKRLLGKGMEKVFVVLGHTHKPKIEKIDKRIIYANSGSWVGKEPTFCIFNKEEKSISLCEWDSEKVKELERI
ncbi:MULTISPECIES: metallophosphoesterase [unclassified Thermosipho (in: thermotogales)]|uniref:UDP-2,3-diacylglucosamine diphosphatase n=1 Tax=unclassified Thermosipho (in: thermotogales) TaxID=2676525 RepID=UPI000985519E|nr:MULTISPECIES: metallophosphoesterase [unclassified Thermosipho (in: thermotogales)]MBT1247031.1 metallophosphoesterase [Thermosipho sp. 1244]OOC46891.1 metallophosphoesterase [Thermosipho sp. 1223]